MPSRDATRPVQHAVCVYKPSVDARDGYSHVGAPRPPSRVIYNLAAVGARCFSVLSPSPLGLLAAFVSVGDLVQTRTH